jgi:hypothetical protein
MERLKVDRTTHTSLNIISLYPVYSFDYSMMEGNNSNGDSQSDDDNYEDNDNNISIPSTPTILPVGRSCSLLVSDWNRTKEQKQLASRLGKRLDNSISTCCSTACMEDSTSSSTLWEGSISSFKYTIHNHVEVDDECEEEQQGNYSATNDFNSMNFIRRRRAKIRAARKAIQPLSMSVKCLPRDLEMKKVEEEMIDKRFY